MRSSLYACLVVASATSAAAWGGGGGVACDESDASAASLVAALKRSDYACAAKIAGAVDSTDLAVNEALMELRSAEQKLKEVRTALTDAQGQGDPSKKMAPAHQWAQSGDEIFVSVKFAHKWDAPATLVGEGDVDAVEFASDKVLVKAHKGSKRFDLEIETLRDIDPDASSWVAASVGRMTLTLRKAAAQKEWWPRLNKGKTKPSNQGVWWDKQELYDAEKEEVQKNEKADAPPRGLAAKLAAKKKAGGSAPAAAEKDDYDDVGGLLQEAPDEETEDKPERAPLTEAVKRAEKRRQLAAKAAKKEKEKVAEDGRAAAAQAQARTKLNMEDVDEHLALVYKQIEADVQKDARDPLFNPTDVPEEFPDVEEAAAFLKKRAKRSKKKESSSSDAPSEDGDAKPKKKRKSKKKKEL